MIEHPMTTLDRPSLIGYPPAPTNGGALSGALPKVGEWVWQPKFDDRRVMIHTPSATIWNQYGALSVAERQKDKFGAALERLARCPFEWLDAGLMEYRHDMMRGCIVVFDVVDKNPHDYRRVALSVAFDELPIDELPTMLAGVSGTIRDQVFLVNEWRDVTDPPLELERLLKAVNAKIGRKFFEGTVAKRADALYPLGMRAKQITPLWVKHRFDQ